MRRDGLICVFLVLVVFAVFGRVWGHEFLTLDDPRYITANPMIQKGLTWEGARWAVFSMDAAFWHPLTWLSLMLDCEVFGLDPGKHHLMSVGYHALSAMLLYLLFRIATGAVWRSLLVAGLFAIHPLHVESVVWAAQRKDVLSAVFWMLTLLCYTWYSRRGRWWRYGMVLIVFALGLAAKPMLVTLPLVMLLLDFWPLKRMKRGHLGPLLVEKVPLLAMAFAAGLATLVAQGNEVARITTLDQRLTRITNGFWSYLDYVGDFLWPVNLIPFYSLVEEAAWVRGALGVLFLGAVSWFCFREARRRPYLLTGWLWYVLTLFPVIGFFRGMGFSKADRYTYTTHIGLYLILAWGLWEGIERLGRARGDDRLTRRWFCLVSALLLGICAVASVRQAEYWRDSVTLFSRGVEVAPRAGIVRAMLAGAYLREGRLEEAQVEVEKVLDWNRGFAVGHGMLGEILVRKGDPEAGIASLEQALQLDPNLYKAHTNLIVAYRKSGNAAKVVEHCEKAMELDPLDPFPLDEMARLRATHSEERFRNGAQAVDLAQRLVSLTGERRPEYLETLAASYAETGDFEKAVKTMERALGLVETSGDEDSIERCRKLLELFREERPFRDPIAGRRND